jgi:polyhydroxybutyrate depolymerase
MVSLLNRYYPRSRRRFQVVLASMVAITGVGMVVAMLASPKRPLAADVLADEQIEVDGETRSYRIVLPHNRLPRCPLVIAFPGVGDSPEAMANHSGLDRMATDGGFILVIPAARHSMWQTLDVTPASLSENSDIRFFDELLAHLLATYDIDADRIYLMGMSNGSSFVQVLATLRSSKVAAIVAHSGSRPYGLGFPDGLPPILLVCGSLDSELMAMQIDADNYRAVGTETNFISVPRMGHDWSTRHNPTLWRFLASHTSRSGEHALPSETRK